MAWYEIINAKSDSYIADRAAEDLLRQLATALQAEDGSVETEVFYGLTSMARAATTGRCRLKPSNSPSEVLPRMMHAN